MTENQRETFIYVGVILVIIGIFGGMAALGTYGVFEKKIYCPERYKRDMLTCLALPSVGYKDFEECRKFAERLDLAYKNCPKPKE